MTNPRASIGKWEGEGALVETFTYDNSSITYSASEEGGSAQVGLAVTISANAGVIALVGDGGFVLGKLLKVESDGTCSVQTKGIVELPGGHGATLTRGKAIVGDQSVTPSNGYIREVETGTAAELGVQNGKIWDAATTTAVVVHL